jgi:signal transduction histidine kinase
MAMILLGADLMDRHRWTAYRHAHAAQRASRAKSEFLSTVSHELRTPLNVIIGYTTLLLDDALDRAAGRDALRRVHHQSLQLLDLIQAMLDLNKVEAGGTQVTVEDFRLGDMIDSLRGGLPTTWCKSDVQLSWVAPTPDTRLRTDRAKLEMIVRNLVHNALKVTEQGSVTVTADASGDPGRVLFTVTDTGAGIAADDLASIFDMFRQANAHPARGHGVGLGLYIVKRFTDALGGEIRVDSTPGAGARFTVALPVEATT